MFKRNGVINMGKERYSILFSSMTGNTKELADAIREILPEETLDYFGLCKDADPQSENCDYFGVKEIGQPQSEMLYIGFWTDKGTADEATTTLLKSLRNKKIFLFGTAGFGGSEEYYQKVLHNVRENIDPSNQIVGEYMCQGKMPMAMRERYVKMKEDPNHKPNLDMLIENFDRALSHPDKADLEKLQKSVLR